MKRVASTIAVIALFGLPAAAGAHVSLHPNDIPAGAFVTLGVRVPGEQPGAYADKVVMALPPGFTDVNLENIPGWSATAKTVTLAHPLQTSGGPVDQEISQITWTGDRSKLGRIDNGYFEQFPVQLTIPTDLAGHSLAFKTVEFYSNGQNAYWIGSPSATYPAPTINITRAGGVIEDVAGNEAGPLPGFVPSGAGSATATVKSASRTLPVIAIVLAALALLAALATLRTRRRPVS